MFERRNPISIQGRRRNPEMEGGHTGSSEGHATGRTRAGNQRSFHTTATDDKKPGVILKNDARFEIAAMELSLIHISEPTRPY